MNLRNCRFLLLILFFSSFSLELRAESEPHNTQSFKDYWYAGKAEITSYKLKQARYGEHHDGYALLIFVTEDFSKNKQVKLDDPYSAKDDAVKVLKLNLVKKFNTGIYKYSIMESIFTPVDLINYPNTVKLTSSSQEWCGHVFTQLNLNDSSYDVNQYSYFESEGDKNFSLNKTILEDEIWTRIRINPKSLPLGEISLLPSLLISRLKHQELQVVKANASLGEIPGIAGQPGKVLMQYKLEFPDSNREFKITFDKNFPHEIISWEEKYKSGFGPIAKTLITKAEKNKSLFTDYWNKNKTLDITLRKELGIE